MTEDYPASGPVPVVIQNWADGKAEPRFVKKTTLQTFLLDSTGAIGQGASAQIAAYEPKRVRMTVQPIDQAIAVVTDKPGKTPDTSTATAVPEGLHLSVGTSGPPNEFLGPDAFWANTVAAGTTRVSVKKEYC